MKKLYKPLNMILNSRLIHLYNNSEKEKQDYILNRVSELIIKYKEYQYKPLYGYLCNLFTSISVCEYDELIGISRVDAINEVRTYMEEFMKPSKIKYERLFSKRWIWPIARRIIPRMMCIANGKGFETKVIKGSKLEMGFDTTKCIFTTILKDLNRLDLACMFCGLDEYMYSSLPGITFVRQGTCSRGHSKCDFRFINITMGDCVETLVDKHLEEREGKVFIPKGTKGTVCEVNKEYVFVEIWGEDAPEGVWGVYDYTYNEIKIFKKYY